MPWLNAIDAKHLLPRFCGVHGVKIKPLIVASPQEVEGSFAT